MSAKTFVRLSEHEPTGQAAGDGESNGNGRTGVLVKLTVKQVSSVIALAVLVAGGAVKYFTRATEGAPAVRVVAAERKTEGPERGDLEEFRREIAKDIDSLRDIVVDTRTRLGRIERRQDRVDDIADAMARIERKVDGIRVGRPPRGSSNVGEGGGSK